MVITMKKMQDLRPLNTCQKLIANLKETVKFKESTLVFCTLPDDGGPSNSTIDTYDLIPGSLRLSLILSWQILRRKPLLLFSFYWHEALRAEKRKHLVKTLGILTFMPLAFDRRF